MSDHSEYFIMPDANKNDCRILYGEVLYVLVDDNRLWVFCIDGNVYNKIQTLVSFLSLSPDELFTTVGRNVAVNFQLMKTVFVKNAPRERIIYFRYGAETRTVGYAKKFSPVVREKLKPTN